MTPHLAPGVPLTLARHRAATLHDVAYDLAFSIPADPAEPIRGEVRIHFILADPACDPGPGVILDFGGDGSAVSSLDVNGVACPAALADEHVVLPAAALRPGANDAHLTFTAGGLAINRQPALVYSLFVPARARFAFPCIDQPDLKARVALTLDVPAGWTGVSNAPLLERDERPGGGSRLRFARTPPLPTYLLAFVAGVLEQIDLQAGGRRVGMFVRPEDASAARVLAGTIGGLHDAALRYVEAYTAVPYPFQRCDIVLIPSFQFSGMEHPGAIYYHAQRLLLDATATQHDQLARASLIAHEVAHLWFGDYVTMRWFDDVWLKEVFASFMADKVVSTLFPGQAHDLRFLLAHYPEAYAADRAAGANPVRQPLENLREAGQLYGPSIYQKAPIVLRQLEALMGEGPLREAVREHLARHPYGSAGWPDLRDDLQRHTTRDLAAWSRAWLDEPGRPRVTVTAGGPDDAPSLVGDDPRGRALTWLQPLAVADPGGHEAFGLVFDGVMAALPAGLATSPCLLPRAYGRVELLPSHRGWLLAHVEQVADPLTRGVAWLTLWDDLVDGAVEGVAFVGTAVRALPAEREQLIVDAVLAWVVRAFWRFVPPGERPREAEALEAMLRAGLSAADTPSARAAWFRALRAVALTDATCDWLGRVWARAEAVPGLPLQEADELQLACELAIRGRDGDRLLAAQRDRMRDTERRAYLDFLAPALSADPAVREEAFARLARHEHRRREPWVLALVRALNHPLREAHACRFIDPGLRRLPELQRTGDIFFPMRWAEALLSGHASREAADAVRAVLDARILPPRLEATVLNAADELFRAAHR